jgi:hypothetical protein
LHDDAQFVEGIQPDTAVAMPAPGKKQLSEMPISDNTAAFGSLGLPARARSRWNKVRWWCRPVPKENEAQARAVRYGST